MRRATRRNTNRTSARPSVRRATLIRSDHAMGSTAANSKLHSRIKDLISWFEIPVYDIHRAAAFYNSIYSMEMEVGYNGDFAMAYFPADKGIGGALIAGPGCIPND